MDTVHMRDAVLFIAPHSKDTKRYMLGFVEVVKGQYALVVDLGKERHAVKIEQCKVVWKYEHSDKEDICVVGGGCRE